MMLSGKRPQIQWPKYKHLESWNRLKFTSAYCGYSLLDHHTRGVYIACSLFGCFYFNVCLLISTGLFVNPWCFLLAVIFQFFTFVCLKTSYLWLCHIRPEGSGHRSRSRDLHCPKPKFLFLLNTLRSRCLWQLVSTKEIKKGKKKKNKNKLRLFILQF